MTVTIPKYEEHKGIYSMTIEISDYCPKCGAIRGIKKWKSFSYDGSRRLSVDSWINECGHIDKYHEVRKEYDNQTKFFYKQPI